MALYVSDLSLFDVDAQVLARGGTRLLNTGAEEAWAGAGTIFLKDTSSTYGRLLLEAGTNASLPPTELPALTGGTFTSLTADGSDAWLAASTPFLDRWRGVWVTLVDAQGVAIDTYEAVELDAAGNLRLAGAALAVGSAVGYAGEYRFDAVILRGGAGLVSSSTVHGGAVDLAGSVKLLSPFTATTIVVRSGAWVQPDSGGRLELQAVSMTVESSAVLDVSSMGYAGGKAGAQTGGAPPNLSGSPSSAGGAHGGLGMLGYFASTRGDTFDSLYQPYLPGGGGGTYYSNHYGGAGGGYLGLDVGTLVLDGEIRARGEDRDAAANSSLYQYTGAGAGGTVQIEAGVLSGGGVIDASGGSYVSKGTEDGGAGGGGRVALLVGDLSAFSVTDHVVVRGGAWFGNDRVTIHGQGGAGTTYVAGGAYGDLIVDQGDSGVGSAPTIVPKIGSGTIGTVVPDTDDPSDLWITPFDPATFFGVGMIGTWLRINGTDYRVIAEAGDLRQILLDDAASTVGVGDAYVGVYKFDKVTVHGGSALQFQDTAEITTTDVDAASTLTIP